MASSDDFLAERFCTPGTSERCGHGICNAEGTFCSCDPGYVNDYMQLLFSNCYLTASGRTGILVALAIFDLFTVLLAFWVRLDKKAVPRRLCNTAMIVGLIGTLQMLSLGLEGKPGAATMFFWIWINVFGGMISPMVLLWGFMSPTFDLLMLTSTRKPQAQRRMKVAVAVWASLHIGLYAILMKYFYDGNYRVYNAILSAHLSGIGLYTAVFMGWIVVYARTLFYHMDKLIANNNERSSKGRIDLVAYQEYDDLGARIEAHRIKLGNVVKATIPMGFAAIAICLAFGITYFSLGVHPYRFILFIFYSLLFPSFNVVLVYFAARPALFKTTSDSSKGARNPSKHDSKSNPTDQHHLAVASTPDTQSSVHGSNNDSKV